MLQLDNQTSWAAVLFPGWGRNRKRQQTLVFKVGYTFDKLGKLSSLPEPPIEMADIYSEKPESSSLLIASEVAPFKKGAEILLSGSAHPSQAGESIMRVEVGLRQGDKDYWKKELRVFGPRTWQRRLLTVLPGKAEPITEPVPLTYEKAYGGSDPSNPEETFLENPAGVGYSLRGLRTKGLSLPRIEIGPRFISSPAGRVQPAGFGPLAPHWQPRCKDLMEIDAKKAESGGCPWAKEPPESLHNTAPLDQRFTQPFEGEMSLSLKGLVADAPGGVLINLPALQPKVLLKNAGMITELQPLCDTLIVQADRQQIFLLFRVAITQEIETNAASIVHLIDPDTEEREETKEESMEATK